MRLFAGQNFGQVVALCLVDAAGVAVPVTNNRAAGIEGAARAALIAVKGVAYSDNDNIAVRELPLAIAAILAPIADNSSEFFQSILLNYSLQEVENRIQLAADNADANAVIAALGAIGNDNAGYAALVGARVAPEATQTDVLVNQKIAAALVPVEAQLNLDANAVIAALGVIGNDNAGYAALVGARVAPEVTQTDVLVNQKIAAALVPVEAQLDADADVVIAALGVIGNDNAGYAALDGARVAPEATRTDVLVNQKIAAALVPVEAGIVIVNDAPSLNDPMKLGSLIGELNAIQAAKANDNTLGGRLGTQEARDNLDAGVSAKMPTKAMLHDFVNNPAVTVAEKSKVDPNIRVDAKKKKYL